ncbi:tetratricopeptide repeat-containing sulfotransferase family protein [Woeseia oceani]|uniref:tetratricopeptide repeat-containing sulfotransferase family protein n=1 Tax=Woeseia oceani TaxID=1548547 RepID=UPI0018D42523|nr:tetratricopeptide repeat-containing sulfotransferase family protein [Woeseia oceani]
MTQQRERFEAASTALRSGDPARAVELCATGLEMQPNDANLLCLGARANLALRQFALAQQYIERALQVHPGFAAAHDVHGDWLLAEGHADRAIRAYEQSLRLDPTRPMTSSKLDRARTLVAHGAQSAPRARRARMAFEEEIKEAQALAEAGDKQRAEDVYRGILRKDPDHVEAARLLAGIAVEHERLQEAEIFLQRAVSLAPDYPRALVDLANVQRDQEKFDEALATADRLIALAPEAAESYMVRASVLGMAGRHEEAIATYRRVLELAPGKAGALCSMAHHLKTVGQSAEAIVQYRAAITARPDHAEAYWSLANLKTFRFTDEEVSAMQALLDAEGLTEVARSQIHNALAFAFEARGDYDRAFGNFEQCNIVRRRVEVYDPVDTETTHDRIISMFDESFVSQTAAEAVDPVPIFVVGLPRSGSTLIEQILASHSQVEGTHELGDLPKAVLKLRRRAPRQQRYPEFLASLNAGGWSSIGREYMRSTAKYRQGSGYFIDKNPNNFAYTGLIRLALPNAKIINARRHPLDSCLGSFKQLFASGQTFSYDMTELGEYYLQYQRLMDHWHRVLPGFVHDVHYEQVVADLDQQVRQLLDFCGLPFEEGCLRFFANKRAVKTASSEQVRQPIYSSSVNLWRKYESHLLPLVHILEPLLTALPADARPAILQKNLPGHVQVIDK